MTGVMPVVVVFPAYAGMFPKTLWPPQRLRSFPRIRGDVPDFPSAAPKSTEFSPHTRGCSHQGVGSAADTVVFPAYAGMFLLNRPDGLVKVSFPRIRGDVPMRERR